MNPADDLLILAQQETLLRFPAFGPHTAWQLGSLLHAALLTQTPGCTVEIELHHKLLFACTTPGAKPNQADWIRRKRNTVRHLRRSSYAVGRELALHNTTLDSAHHLDEADFAAHGGGFPIRLNDDPETILGTITLSGLPQRDDHNLVVTAIAQQLGVTIPQLA
jgi:uncharacterized protein (UPF0303 family)